MLAIAFKEASKEFFQDIVNKDSWSEILNASSATKDPICQHHANCMRSQRAHTETLCELAVRRSAVFVNEQSHQFGLGKGYKVMIFLISI